MARLHVLEMQPTQSALWALGRRGAMVGLVALLVALVVAPRPALLVLWNVAVPLLPASFFIAPALWRGICPLSTLNAWGNRLGTPRDLTSRETTWLAVGGLLLFQAMVPARHLSFNTDGTALVITIAAVGAIAVMCGARFTSRSAFCNALCPVLPVERLYGQAPLVQITRGRCDTCNVCTPSGCIDLADRKAMRQVLGAPRHGTAWLRTPFGLFATALPGFIAAYGLIPDTHGSDPLPIYAATLSGSLASHPVARLLIEFTAMLPARAVCRPPRSVARSTTGSPLR